MNSQEIASLYSAEIVQPTISDLSYAASITVGGKSYVHIQMDPATAAALTEIGKAILINLGAKALSKWFGFANDKDVEALFRQLLLDLADVVRLALDEQSVKMSTSDLQGLNTLMREYLNSPATSQFRIETCITQSALSLKRLENLMPLSANAYIFGSLVRLASLQEYANITGSTAERKNVADFAIEATPKLKAAFETLLNSNQNRVTAIKVTTNSKADRRPIIEPQLDIEREPHDPVYWYYEGEATYYVDGVRRHFVDSTLDKPNDSEEQLRSRILQAAEAARSLDVNRVRDDFWSRVGVAMLNSINQFEEISKLN